MRKLIGALFVILFFTFATSVNAQTRRISLSPTITPTVTATSTPTETPKPERADLTEKSQETLGPLEKLLRDQDPGNKVLNPFKHAIRGAVQAGVPANTIVLLLLLPGVAAIIAAARHLIGLRGFGIFLPAALSVVFVATGPLVGMLLFLIIVTVSTITRIGMRKGKIKLQYLPRMSIILHLVVLGILGVLFLAPLVGSLSLSNVSIFPVLILVLLAEDFSRVQLGKSAKVALNLASETIILALVSYVFLTTSFVQRFALTNPEVFIVSILAINILMGKYVGLRLMEYWRFKKLLEVNK